MDMYPKIVSFLWLCLHNSIPVREVLAARGISSASYVPYVESKMSQLIICLESVFLLGIFGMKFMLPGLRLCLTIMCVIGCKITVKACYFIAALSRGILFFHLLSGAFGNTATKLCLKMSILT